MNLPSLIKTIEPLSSSSGENGGQAENNVPGPSHRIESGLKVEGSAEFKGPKDTKAHCSKSVDDARICKICYNGELGVVFLPCGHMVACVDCAPEMTICAVCRVHVAMKVRAFLS